MGNALFIIWRESAEAMLVVGILYAWLRKHPDMARGMRYLWAGVGAGVGRITQARPNVMAAVRMPVTAYRPKFFSVKLGIVIVMGSRAVRRC